MLASEVITEAREKLADTVAPYRFDDPKLLRRLTIAQKKVAELRPDALYLTSVTTTQPGTVSALGDTLVVADTFLMALAHYVCYLTFFDDNEDPANASRALAHIEAFRAEMS